MGLIKEDARSLDYSSYSKQIQAMFKDSYPFQRSTWVS